MADMIQNGLHGCSRAGSYVRYGQWLKVNGKTIYGTRVCTP